MQFHLCNMLMQFHFSSDHKLDTACMVGIRWHSCLEVACQRISLQEHSPEIQPLEWLTGSGAILSTRCGGPVGMKPGIKKSIQQDSKPRLR